MITLTDVAADHALVAIDKQPGDPIGLRIFVKGGGCSGFSYGLDFAYQIDEHDKVIESNGIQLLVDRKSLLYLAGMELDWEMQGLLGGGFKFNNPNAKRSCGCGESFSV